MKEEIVENQERKEGEESRKKEKQGEKKGEKIRN